MFQHVEPSLKALTCFSPLDLPRYLNHKSSIEILLYVQSAARPVQQNNTDAFFFFPCGGLLGFFAATCRFLCILRISHGLRQHMQDRRNHLTVTEVGIHGGERSQRSPAYTKHMRLDKALAN